MALISISGFQVIWAVVGLSVAKVVYEYLASPLRHIPGPFLAKLTDFYRAALTRNGDVGSSFINWHKQCGSAVRVGPNTVSLSDPAMIRVLYSSKNSWSKSDMYRPNDVIVNGHRIENIFNTRDKAFHAKYSRPIAGFWTRTKILELEPFMDETLHLLISTLDARFAKGDAPKCMLDKWLTYYAWDAVSNVTFGRHWGFLEKARDIDNILAESEAGLKYFAPVSQVPWIDDWLDKNPIIRLGPRPLVNGVLHTVRILSEYQERIAAGELDEKHKKLFMSRYNNLLDTVDFVDNQQVVNWLMINVLAGGDSTAGAMMPIAYELARHPENQAKLAAELDQAGISVPAQWKEVKDLKYLDAVIYESQRVCPALGLMLERVVPAGGFELPDGRFLPGGTKVGMNPCVVTRDQVLFGDDVETFRPERWLRHDGESEEEFGRRYQKMAEATDLIFGGGNRVCMGRFFAKTEMYKLFATLYRIYDIQLTDPRHEWKYFNAWFMYHSDMPMVIKRRRLEDC